MPSRTPEAPPSFSRRNFLKTSLAAGTGSVDALVRAAEAAAGHAPFSLPLGVCAEYKQAPLLRELGYSFVEERVNRFLIPDSGDAGYAQNRQELQASRFPIWSYIYFFPGNLKSVGPDLHHEAILARADLALQRAKECGSKNIVFGSGGSRAIPAGFDRDQAKAQHIELSRKMAPLAEKHGITLAIEPLNRGETNFINSLADGAEIVEAVNHPRFKLLCDIYHMLKEDEPPEEIVKYRRHIVHCHIAEKQKRTAPGVAGDDFKPYFRALKKAKYTGGLSLECNWTNFEQEVKQGIAELKKQFNEV